MNLTDPYVFQKPLMIIVMLSTVGAGLAKNISVPFIDGDSLHPQSSVDKMSAGQPLTDEDRLPWLHAIRRTGIQKCREEFENDKVTSTDDGGIGRPAVVIACSALKKKYRNVLRGTAGIVDEPEGSPELLQKRISERKGHFMKPDMLASQLATLEDPEKEGGVVTVDISKTQSEVIDDATEGIRHLVTVMDHQGL
ncbi:cytoplasm protein [Trichosporon asahii var. asahii CBS 2479]|uniref:Gluconokinase n=1 Tax=Trichosporon asahii var. asahii (strain ATCC 90039 / CBS 2479 / JCM 2466 / KCTC 7840 / NBRC 103889/ NCYC 2677 / UAMH 7654) TaxID=1186058 RepID=J6F2P9_TRIAS|nr:cytoplasm protein [Trichosporon asahii var. asahii CBS 2479]EJT49467.1 cytoplasm protein [Trichosporon asahii var. asahii CBS 2479]